MSRPGIGALALVLGVAAGGVVASGARRDAASERTGAAFQTLVHGLGLGPSLDLSDPASAFDPRVAGARVDRLVPLLAGSSLGPRAGRVATPP